MSSGLQEQGVSASVAHDVANTPPVGSLFAAFLGYNPIAELLAPSHALQQPGVNADHLTGKTFFPDLLFFFAPCVEHHHAFGCAVRLVRDAGDVVEVQPYSRPRTSPASASSTNGVASIGMNSSHSAM